jgi:shikimate kinase
MSSLAGRRGRVYLTGFMGSGKSTVGPILANTIGYDFVDVDRTIEEAEGMSVGEMFRVRGEGFFRQKERAAIARLPREQKLVVALGGGALVDPANRETIRTTGVLVYLRVPKELLMKRLQHRENRPLLTDAEGSRLSEEYLRERVEALFQTREPFYAKADLIIDVDERHVGVTVDRVARMLVPFLGQ